MKKDFSLGLASFIVSVGVICGIWGVLKIDKSARGVGFSDLGEQIPISFSMTQELPSRISQSIAFLLDYPQLLPFPIRFAAWGAAYSNNGLRQYTNDSIMVGSLLP